MQVESLNQTFDQASPCVQLLRLEPWFTALRTYEDRGEIARRQVTCFVPEGLDSLGQWRRAVRQTVSQEYVFHSALACLFLLFGMLWIRSQMLLRLTSVVGGTV
ncbi:MAG: hypothetical protein ABS56_03930 [Lautropia sp. SCN 69-89]|nr:MAG: hypothetical protein ABS56_03930 [Lautropia sp. SCN 69-89]